MVSCKPDMEHKWERRAHLDRSTDGWLGHACLNCGVIARFPPKQKKAMTNVEMVEWVLGLGANREERIARLEDMIKNAQQDAMSPDDYTICETALAVLKQMEEDDRAWEALKKKNRIRASLIVDMEKEEDELWTPITTAPTTRNDTIEAAYTFPKEDDL